MHEIFISMASNVKNKFSYGFTLGIPVLTLNEQKAYTETDPNNQVDFFDQLNFEQNIAVKGAGVNLKAGLIYKINLKTRIGLAIHSPTWLFIQDDYSTALTYDITSANGPESFFANTAVSTIEYQIRTPFRVIAGLSHIYSLSDDFKGFVSADAEYLNYSSINFSDSPTADADPLNQFIFRDINQITSNTLAQAFNFRVGTEIAYQKFRARVGAHLAGSVSKNSDFIPNLGYSAGLGFRGNKIYIDVSAGYQSLDQVYTPYRLLDANRDQRVSNVDQRLIFKLTFGSKI